MKGSLQDGNRVDLCRSCDIICTLYECREHEFCINRKGGIYYEKGTAAAGKEVSPETEDRN